MRLPVWTTAATVLGVEKVLPEGRKEEKKDFRLTGRFSTVGMNDYYYYRSAWPCPSVAAN